MQCTPLSEMKVYFNSECVHLVAAARHCQVRFHNSLKPKEMAEECKQCTKLAIQTFTNQMLPLGLLFRMNFLICKQMLQMLQKVSGV